MTKKTNSHLTPMGRHWYPLQGKRYNSPKADSQFAPNTTPYSSLSYKYKGVVNV